MCVAGLVLAQWGVIRWVGAKGEKGGCRRRSRGWFDRFTLYAVSSTYSAAFLSSMQPDTVKWIYTAVCQARLR